MDIVGEFFTKTPKETQKLGVQIGNELKGSDRSVVVCLYGELGSGKTTLVQGIAKGLGIKGRLLSPTFIIVRRYQFADVRQVYHLDLYRMESSDFFDTLGISEMFEEPGSIVFIEWPERLGAKLPKHRIDIQLAPAGEKERRMHITNYD